MTALRSALTGLILGVLMASGVFAQDNLKALLSQLRAQGYREIEVERTWLGRYRIEAKGRSGEREIILNDRTGEVLRDYVDDDDDDDDDENENEDRSGHRDGSGADRSGRSGGDDDDDEDNSGHGSEGDDDGGDDDGDDDGDGDD